MNFESSNLFVGGESNGRQSWSIIELNRVSKGLNLADDGDKLLVETINQWSKSQRD